MPDESETERLLDKLPPPNPLLPKTTKLSSTIPESCIKGIVFRKLKRFKRFTDQADDTLGNYSANRNALEITN